MSLIARVQNYMNSTVKAHEKAKNKALEKLGKFIYRSVRSGIRRSKKPSKPGRPVHTQTGFFKDSIFIQLDRTTGSYRIYPRMGDLKIFELHEHGGYKDLVAYKFKKYENGRWRWVESPLATKEKFEAIRSKYPNRVTDVRIIRVKYPQRSYLQSAVEKGKSDFLRKYPDDYRRALGPGRSILGPGSSGV